MEILIQVEEDELKDIKQKYINKVPFYFLNRKYILESYYVTPNYFEKVFDLSMTFKEIKKSREVY